MKPSPGLHSSRRWIVVASAPVSSLRRRAALPVGAHSRAVAARPLTSSTSVRIVALLPVPGPPVRIDRRCSSACVTPRHWSSRRHERAGLGSRHAAQAQRRLGVKQRAHVRREAPLDRVQPGVGDAAGVDDDLAARGELVDRVADLAAAKQARGALGQLGARQVAVAVGLGLTQRVQHARPPAGRGRQAACRARARARRRSRSRCRRARRSRTGRAAAARSSRRRSDARCAAADAASTPCVSRNSRSSRSSRWSRHEATAPTSRRGPMPGTDAQDALGVAVDRRQHLVGAEALDQPRGAERADVLDRLQVGEQRRGRRRARARARGRPETASRGARGAARRRRRATDSPSCTCASGPTSTTSSPSSVRPRRARRSRRRARSSARPRPRPSARRPRRRAGSSHARDRARG